MEAATHPVRVPVEPARPPKAVRRKRLLIAVADHSILIGLAIAFLAPFVFIVLTALMTNDQALSSNLWPQPFRFGNFRDVFDRAPLLTYGLNSFLYAGLATLGVLISSVPVAYALSKMRWKGRNVAFVLVLATMMLPPQVTIVPLYVMFSKLHLVGTIWPLIIPNWFGDAFSIFLLRQFFLTIPEEYSDAARVDGCRRVPGDAPRGGALAKPALVAVALFSFLYAGTTSSGRCFTRARTRPTGRCRSASPSSATAPGRSGT